MMHLSIKLMPESGNYEFAHNFGDLEVQVKVDRSFKLRDVYSFMVFNEQLVMMAGATSWKDAHYLSNPQDKPERTGRVFTMTMHGRSVWMPGRYFFLMSNGKGRIVRIDLTLDDHGGFTMDMPRECAPLSDESMLVSHVFYEYKRWNILLFRPGTSNFRRWSIDRLKWDAVNEYKTEVAGESSTVQVKQNNNLLISMNTQSDFFGYVKSLWSALDLPGVLREADCSKFYDPGCNNPHQGIDEVFNDKTSDDYSYLSKHERHVVYFFHNIGSLNDGSGRAALSRLYKVWNDNNHDAIFCGTKAEIDALLEQNPKMRDRFTEENRIDEQPYMLDEVLNLFFWRCKNLKLRLSPAAVDKVCRLLVEASGMGLLWRWSDEEIWRYLTTRLIPQHNRNAVLAAQQGAKIDDCSMARPEDIDESDFLSAPATVGGLLDELDSMVGLEDIKRSIITLHNRRQFFTQRRQLGLRTCDEGSYHAVFTGNPGTGKTTVAKTLGRIYHSLGLLSKGEVICVDRSTMVGRYIGQTEENMKQILEQARGNVLLIDEAYTLCADNYKGDFGHRAVECLLTVLTNKHPDMVIIFAGYKEEMEAMLDTNPGLAGRFPYRFHFSDYNADQLMQIALSILEKDEYVLTDEARVLLHKTIRAAVAHRSRTFANARWVEQFIHNGVIPAMADRLNRGEHAFDAATYQTVEAADVEAAHAVMNRDSECGAKRNFVGFRA